MSALMQTLGLLSAAVIFLRIEPVLNLMGPQCRLPVRAAFWLVATGSASLFLVISQGYVPALPLVLLATGLALLLTTERRLRNLHRRHRPINERRKA